MKYKCIRKQLSFTKGKVYELVFDKKPTFGTDQEPTDKNGLLVDDNGKIRRNPEYYNEYVKVFERVYEFSDYLTECKKL